MSLIEGEEEVKNTANIILTSWIKQVIKVMLPIKMAVTSPDFYGFGESESQDLTFHATQICSSFSLWSTFRTTPPKTERHLKSGSTVIQHKEKFSVWNCELMSPKLFPISPLLPIIIILFTVNPPPSYNRVIKFYKSTLELSTSKLNYFKIEWSL